MRLAVIALACPLLWLCLLLGGSGLWGGGCGGPIGSPAPSPPAVRYKVYGLCFSPFLELDPQRGATVSPERIARLLDIIAPYCQWIRTFGATQGQEHVPRLAQARGLRVAAACWLSRDAAANAREIESLQQLIRAGVVDLAIVGTETLYRQDLTEAQLLSYIQHIKALGVPTTTNDTWSELLQHPAICAACDVIMANFYPYWEGVALDQAVRRLHQNYMTLKQAVGEKPIIVGETGWPSAGNAVGEAVPSGENAAFYFLNFVSWARAERVDYFYFEAFDEAWKAAYEGPQGAHWGLWDGRGRLKAGMERVFAGETVPDNWSPAPPRLELTYVPPYGSFANLRGKASGVDPAAHKVAVYIYVNGWWTKPYWEAPLTPLRPDGSFECDITTGGHDEFATRIVAYLVPNGYMPPLLAGEAELPAELETHALAKAEATRAP